MSLTQAEAELRAQHLSEIAYDLSFEIDASDSEHFVSQTKATFSCDVAGFETFIEVANASDIVVTINGEPVSDSQYKNGRIPFTAVEGRNSYEVTAVLPYAADGDGMHRYVDPADDQIYVCGFAGMDVAQRMFACFDQPDLKGTLSVAARVPAPWEALANGTATRGDEDADGNVSYSFSITKPISTYLFVLCVGPWASRTWEYAGRTFGWHARASMASQLDRDLPELRRITEQCFSRYHELFDTEYPFGDYHQIFAPGLNWGALETPGCITFRDEYLPIEEPTRVESAGRATTIAHEMAHMWFGNLVTMKWWVDTWLNESFADYMGYRMAGEAAGFNESWASFAMARKLTAYQADECASTHPVAPGPRSVRDVDQAFNNFDMISYAKGTSVLRQFVTWLGDDDFFRGLNNYLHDNAFGNAEFEDLLSALDKVSDKDVLGWAGEWFQQTGFDSLAVKRGLTATIELSLTGGGAAPTAKRPRSHVFQAAGFALPDGDQMIEPLVGPLPVSIGPDSGPVSLVGESSLIWVPNVEDLTYAAPILGPAAMARIGPRISDIANPVTRGVLWWAVWHAVQRGALHTSEASNFAVSGLAHEKLPTVLSRLNLGSSWFLYPYMTGENIETLQSRYATGLAYNVARPETSDELRRIAANEWTSLSTDVEALRFALEGGTVLDVPSDMDLRWKALQRLVSLGEADMTDIDGLRREDATARGNKMRALCVASQPNTDSKLKALHAFTSVDPSRVNNRMLGATLTGLFCPHQLELWRGEVVDAFFEGMPSLGATSQGLARVIVQASPFSADENVLADYDAALDKNPTAVLARGWADNRDRLRRRTTPS